MDLNQPVTQTSRPRKDEDPCAKSALTEEEAKFRIKEDFGRILKINDSLVGVILEGLSVKIDEVFKLQHYLRR